MKKDSAQTSDPKNPSVRIRKPFRLKSWFQTAKRRIVTTHENIIGGTERWSKPLSASDEGALAIECKLLEQEHRLVHLLVNYFGRNRWEKGDPRRDSTLKAIFWYFVSPVAVAATGGSILALASLYLLYCQNGLIQEQNTMFKQQNEFLRDQNKNLQVQVEISRQQMDVAKEQTNMSNRTRLISSLFDQVTPEQTNPSNRTWLISSLFDQVAPEVGRQKQKKRIARADPRTRSEAVREFLAMERKSGKPNTWGHVEINLRGAILSETTLKGVDFQFVDLQDVDFTDADCSNCDFRGASLDDSAFVRTNLTMADFRKCFLSPRVFREANLCSADFREAKMDSFFLAADISIGDLDNANFWGTQMSSALQEKAKKDGAVEIQFDDKWKRRVKLYPGPALNAPKIGLGK